MKEKPRLGKGLDALFTGAGEAAAPQAVVPIGQIQQNPFQPRKEFDAEELSGLCDSIKNHGLLQPLVVRAQGDHYQLIAGERRLRAAQTIGITDVPVRVVDFNDQQVLEAALVENIQRADLNPIEKALGFKDYLDRFGMTQEQLAAKLGLDRTTITNLLGLLDLPREVQDAVRLKQISLGHAKVLKGLKDRERQAALCRDVIARGLSVHATEALVKQPAAAEKGGSSSGSSSGTRGPAAEKTAHVLSLEDELRTSLLTPVEIRLKARDRGQIILGFESNDDFQRLLELLRKGA